MVLRNLGAPESGGMKRFINTLAERKIARWGRRAWPAYSVRGRLLVPECVGLGDQRIREW